MNRTTSSAALLAAGLFTLTIATAAPASAHVTVSSANAKQGGYGVLTFRAPTESDTASTTSLDIQFPTDHPLKHVSVKPHAGWSYKVVTSKLPTPVTIDGEEVSEAVTELIWTADSPATAVKPGEFDEFSVSAGPLPDTETLTFKTIQKYSDGTEVAWINVPAPGSTAKVEKPAPTLTLAPATPAPAAAEAGAGTSSNRTGIALGGLGTALGAAGLALGLRRKA